MPATPAFLVLSECFLLFLPWSIYKLHSYHTCTYIHASLRPTFPCYTSIYHTDGRPPGCSTYPRCSSTPTGAYLPHVAQSIPCFLVVVFHEFACLWMLLCPVLLLFYCMQNIMCSVWKSCTTRSVNNTGGYDHNLVPWPARIGTLRLDLLHNVHALEDLAENDMLSIEPRRYGGSDKELRYCQCRSAEDAATKTHLRAVGVGSGIGHREQAGTRVLD